MTDATLRRSWFVSAAALALWAVSTVSLLCYIAVLGRAGVRRQISDQLSRSALETGPEPLVLLLGTTLALGGCAVLSLLYYTYAQWRHAKRRRRRLESLSAASSASDLETDADRRRVR